MLDLVYDICSVFLETLNEELQLHGNKSVELTSKYECSNDYNSSFHFIFWLSNSKVISDQKTSTQR